MLRMTIRTDTEAFQGTGQDRNKLTEIARILRQTALKVESNDGDTDSDLYDIDGNFVGRVEID